MRLFIAIASILFGTLTSAAGAPSRRADRCSTPVIYFDLGETLIHSDYLQKFDVFVNTRYPPGAYRYLRELRRRGFTLALLVNYPESYGGGLPTIEERDARKLRILKAEVNEPLPERVTSQPEFAQHCQERYGARAERLCRTWTDPSHDRFDWSFFQLPEFSEVPGIETGGILVPDKDSQRKPTPYLFERALEVARLLHKRSGDAARPCPVIFMGENADEIKAATEAGMIGILLGQGSWSVGRGHFSFYYPIPLLRKLAGNPEVIKPDGPRIELQ